MGSISTRNRKVGRGIYIVSEGTMREAANYHKTQTFDREAAIVVWTS